MAARWMTASMPSRAAWQTAGSQTSPLSSSKKRFGQQGEQAVAAELQGVENADAVSLLEEHRDQGRADVTGSAGDENSHGGLHPWWLESRLERRVYLSLKSGARRGRQQSRPSSVRAESVVALAAVHHKPVASI